MGRFAGKVVIITGASSGIGAATAMAFAEEGAKLAICGRNKERLREVATKCRGIEGCEVLEIICDLSAFDNLKIVVDKTVEKFQGIDILINSAGISGFTETGKLELEQFDKIMNINFRAPVFLCKYALPYLSKSKGSVVNVSSIMSDIVLSPNVIYSSSKAALDQFTRGFAAECVSLGIRVNSVNPGPVKTRILDALNLPKIVMDMIWRGMEKGLPFGVIEPEEIADVITSIISWSHMSGTCITMDGGYMAGRNHITIYRIVNRCMDLVQACSRRLAAIFNFFSLKD